MEGVKARKFHEITNLGVNHIKKSFPRTSVANIVLVKISPRVQKTTHWQTSGKLLTNIDKIKNIQKYSFFSSFKPQKKQ